MGHRIAKHVYTEESTDLLYSTYYILDAQGNVMSTYNRVIDSETPSVLFHQTEKYIYGSSRLGVLNDSIPLYGSQNNWEIVDGVLPMDSLSIISVGELCTSTASWYYEGPGMSGVVNNGFATFTDSNSPTDSYLSTQLTANIIPGETYTLSFDVSDRTNLSSLSVYIYSCTSSSNLGDQPIPTNGNYQLTFTVPDVWTDIRIKWWGTEQVSGVPMSFSLSSIQLDGPGIQFSNDTPPTPDTLWVHTIGKRNYELSNHLGNVLSVISDKPIPTAGTSVIYENHFDDLPDNFIYENDFSSSLNGFYAVGLSSVSLSSGRQEVNTGFDGLTRIDLSTVAGHKYMVSYNIDLDTIGVTYGRAVETVSGAALFQQYQAFDGTYSFMFEATTNSTSFYYWVSSTPSSPPRTFYLDDFSVNDITGEEAYEPFFGSYSVSLSIESNRLKAEHIGTWTQPSMYFASENGHTYRATATLDVDASASFNFSAFDGPTGAIINNVWVTSDNTYSFEFTAIDNSCRIDFQSSASGEHMLYIDDFIIEDITSSVAYMADIRQSTDYSAFGAPMPGRQFNSSSYRYGYQGYEGDPEMKGNGNSYTTEFRQYDPRLGRWLTTDPIIHEYQGPYCGFDNNPILHTDPKGTTVNGDYYDVKTGKKLGTDGINDGKVFEISKSQWNKLSSEAAPNYGDQSFQNASYAYGSKQVYGSEANAYIFGTKSKTYESQQAVAKTQQQSKEMVRPQNVPKPKPVATQPQVANVPAPQPSDQFGIGGTNTVQLPLAVSTAPPVTESESSGVSGTTVTGILMAASGEPWINKSSSFAKLIFPRSATVMGAQPMTSFSSLAVRRATTSLGVKGATGRIASRAIPIVGEGLLIWDGLDFLWTNREAFGYGMQLRQEYIDQGLMPLR